MADLQAMIEPLPAEIRENITANPVVFLERLTEVLDLSEEIFLIADKTNSIGSEYEPSDLVNLEDYPFYRNRSGMQLRAVVIPDALAMSEAARQEGIRLVFSSTYRSNDYQKTVYERKVRELGETQANRESAKPGTSQHQLGTAVDFGSITDAFADTPAGKWLYANAWKYGFSLSYPDGYEELTGYRHEIWHYRWISRPAAYLEHAYFNSLQHYLLLFLDTNRETLTRVYNGAQSREAI